MIHHWQRGALDDQYPQSVPANAATGGDLGVIADMAADAALQENYIHYYMDYPGFDRRRSRWKTTASSRRTSQRYHWDQAWQTTKLNGAQHQVRVALNLAGMALQPPKST